MPDARTAPPAAVKLADYAPPGYRVPRIHLDFELNPTATRVHARMEVERLPGTNGPLVLFGDEIGLDELLVDGGAPAADRWRREDDRLTIEPPADRFTVDTRVTVNPDANTALSGLYRSSGNFCTQCEPEGFRRITWFPDRPDVLSEYTVTITADPAHCPVMLANGDRVGDEVLDGGRRRVTWHDPWPKPSYLFALVAGDLGCLRDRFVTRSGREVSLELYAQHHNMDQCDHAMASLKRAMRWDEESYGREYDLDTYMIVAVDDFNMGAMENKGLNVFNSRYVLARPETATDQDFEAIEGVIGHEYFHNWSGNRVTCRDWFQLSLKEGFTVFRDQEFSADMGSRGVKRIQDVDVLRAHQFPEDSGPMAHPVRPDSYLEINNFYTVTIYNKGAEVVRMLYHLLGAEGFRRGCDLYFERHDGEAVTTDDFLRAHEDANGRDLAQFRRWYEQAGTPRVTARLDYDSDRRVCRLTLSQECPPTPGQPHKAPFHIPIRGALFSAAGEPLACRLDDRPGAGHEHVFELDADEREFLLHDVAERPVPSLLRGFSAPVRMDAGLDDAELAVLMAHDDDPFNRWDAGQRLSMRQILGAARALGQGAQPQWDDAYLAAFGRLLEARIDDGAVHAMSLALPDYPILAEEVERVDPSLLLAARDGLLTTLAGRYRALLEARYREFLPEPAYDAADSGRRALKNRLLGLICAGGGDLADRLCREQFQRADNMTDRLAALDAACRFGLPASDELLERFFADWREHALIVDKWLRVQSTSPVIGDLERIRRLMAHQAYNDRNPNKVRALLGAFFQANPRHFHRDDGSGYRLLTGEVLRLDPVNPQLAARLLSALNPWRRYADPWRAAMGQALEEIHARESLSRDSREIVERALAEPA